MTRNRQMEMRLCLVLILICTLLPKPARADDGSRDRPIRLYATERFGPIGRVYSLGALIDGRSTYGEQAIWGGELIQTMAASRVSIEIDLVGRITLKNAATARLSMTVSGHRDGIEQYLFVASLIDGDMAVRLQQDAGAYVESRGTAFTSSLGANFVISAREGGPAIDVSSGTVKAEPQPADLTFTGRTVVLVNGLPRPVTGTDTITTNTKKKVRIAIQFTKTPLKVAGVTRAFSPRYVMFSNQATQIEIPAAGRRVQLSVDPAVGTIAPTESVTDANGVVEAELTAGSNQATGTIRAKVVRDPGDSDKTDYKVYERTVIVKKVPVFRTRNLLVGAAAITTIIVIVERPAKGPIQQQPPAVIIQ